MDLERIRVQSLPNFPCFLIPGAPIRSTTQKVVNLFSFFSNWRVKQVNFRPDSPIRSTVKPSILKLILLAFVLSACTREAPETTRISLVIPESAASFSKGLTVQAMQVVGAQAVMSKWALATPANFSDINCFAVMIFAPELKDPVSNSCVDINGGVVGTPQFIQGGFLRNSAISIEVPSGLGRVVKLVGFRTSSDSLCIDLAGNTSASRFSSAQFSSPVILATATVDLSGADVNIDMKVPSLLSSSMTFEDCAPALFSNDVTPSEPTATIDDGGMAAVNNLSANNFTIGGAYTYEYDTSLLLTGSGSCSDAIFSGNYVSATIPFTAVTGTDGSWVLCVKARSASGKEQTVASMKAWVRDTFGPAGGPPTITMAALGNDSTPDITVSTLPSGSTQIFFFSGSGCVNEVSRANMTVPGVVTLPTQAAGAQQYYAYTTDVAGNPSACTSTALNYFLDLAAPDAPGGLSARYATSLEYTPYFTWSSATDAAPSSGVAYYQVALGTGTTVAAISDLSGWTSLGNSFSAFSPLGTFFINGNTYYFSVRAIDAAGNFGSSSTQAFVAKIEAQWLQQAFVKGGASSAQDEFGGAVAIEADTMVVGAASSDRSVAVPGVLLNNAGEVTVYKRSGNLWAVDGNLNAVDRAAGDNFGYSVAISGDTVVVGAPKEASAVTGVQNAPVSGGGSTTASTGSGAVYVFRRSLAGVWVPEAYIKAPTVVSGGYFGTSVAIASGTIVVGAPGASNANGNAYVFKRSGSTWSYVQALTYTAIPFGSNRFGAAVSISGSDIAVGAPNDSTYGAVYFFSGSSNTWSEQQMITPPAGTESLNDYFGASLQLFDKLLVIGAPGEDSSQSATSSTGSVNNSATDSGAAYVYRQSGGTYGLERFLKPPNNAAGNKFGASVGVFGTTIVVGVPGHDGSDSLPSFTPSAFFATPGGTDSGGIFVFQGGSSGTWEWSNFFKPTFNWSGGPPNMGSSVAISGSAIVTGAPAESSDSIGVLNGAVADSDFSNSTPQSGAAYVFEVYDASFLMPILISPPPGVNP